jgi:hypothetical protein
MISSGLITSMLNGTVVLIEFITYSDGKRVKRIIDPRSLLPMHVVKLN